ncbi:TonB-dependent receptor [Phenylobacterium sp. RIFCSPHIGHO2_01_FULL_69_31]|uniref:TonB-dependent receptor plug domain-containing protein n=1 Tax=Phenylobacterium sp. RIFCSPHIGHO2_01_FULL_69_31 TaxID=1801944 RepID=UPI000A8DAA5D|nr:TonB-dependent receptor [Phenylobacterium sp. RIFCSPHIGHO2_01_FULL_69_31]
MPLKSDLLLWASPVAAFVALAAAPAAAQDTVANFDIAAQPMQGALNALSAQSGVRLLYPYDRVSGLTSPAVRGRMATRSALGQIIAGSPLRVAMAQKDLIALSASAPPAALIRTASAGPIYAAATAMAVQDEGAGAPAAPTALDELVVTGARGAPRTVTDSPTPIDVLSAADLEKTGRAGAFQALQTLVPSFNLPARAGGGTSTVISTGGLRGLNPDQTLVLVNGKRRHKTSLINSVSSLYNGSVPADLDHIPVPAIGRIEVLRDGAAAQYGSDAIAGVINIILRETEGGFVSGSFGQNFDRSDGELWQFQANYGSRIGEQGFLNLSLASKSQELSNRAIPVASTVQLYPRINGQPDPRELTADRLVTKNSGVLPQESISFGYNGRYDLEGGVQLYSFGTFSRRLSDLPFTFRSPNNVNTLPQIYPEGFRPNLVIRERDFEVALGARGELSGWSWDISSTYGYNRARENTSNTLNASLGPTSPTVFYVGQLKSTEWVNSLDVTRPFDLEGAGQLQVSFGAQHRRETYSVGAGEPLSYAAGTYVIPAGQPFAGQRPQTGAQATPGFQPSDASKSHRNNFAGYVELGWEASDRLFLGAAARYEDYSDSAGDTLVGKLNARFELTDWLAVRGAVSTGFRAPGLAQQNYAASSSQFRLVNGVLDLLQIKTLPVGSPEAIALGAEPLKPEESTNYSVGLTLEPMSNLAITVDAYRIEVDKRIAITSTLTGAAVSNILIANGLPGSLSAQYYTNAIDTRTDGIDVVATYRADLGEWGSLRATAGYNWNDTDITGIIPNPPELSALGPAFVLFDRLSQGYLTRAFPKDKIALSATWTWNDLTLNGRATRFGKYFIQQNAVANDRAYGAEWIVDLEVAYKLPHRVTVAVGANNLFNNYPDANGIFNANTGAGQYPGTSPIGFTGGSYYGRIQWEF